MIYRVGPLQFNMELPLHDLFAALDENRGTIVGFKRSPDKLDLTVDFPTREKASEFAVWWFGRHAGFYAGKEEIAVTAQPLRSVWEQLRLRIWRRLGLKP